MTEASSFFIYFCLDLNVKTSHWRDLFNKAEREGGGVEIEFKFEPFAVNHLAILFLYIPGCTSYYSLKQMFFNN